MGTYKISLHGENESSQVTRKLTQKEFELISGIEEELSEKFIFGPYLVIEEVK